MEKISRNSFLSTSKVKKYLTQEKIFSGIVYFLLFLFTIYAYRDYDWGWHYRYGEHLVKTGQLLIADPFSWTMPGYQWVNHSWLYDPILYLIFTGFGFIGLSIAGALVVVVAFYFGIKGIQISYWKKALLAFIYANLIGGIIWQGLRSQMVGFMLLSIFLWMMRELDKQSLQSTPLPAGLKKRWTYFAIPLLFLLWANMHAYFTLGLLIFAVGIGVDFILSIRGIRKEKNGFFIPKEIIIKVGIFTASFFATFINPFHVYVYLEALRHSRSPLLKYVTEWLPADTFSEFYFYLMAYTAILLIFVVKRRKLKDLKWFLFTVITFILALGARRYIALYIVTTLPLAASFFQSVKIPLEKYKTTTFLFIVGVIVSLELAFFSRFPSYHLYSYSYNDYCELGSGCSEGLTAYLMKHPPQGRGLNFYDWGGYMIGRGVPFKLFIDGRMHLWEGKNTHFQPFLSYRKMYYDQDYNRFVQDDFDWFIGQANSDLAVKLRKGDLGNWKTAYEDPRVVLMMRVR